MMALVAIPPATTPPCDVTLKSLPDRASRIPVPPEGLPRNSACTVRFAPAARTSFFVPSAAMMQPANQQRRLL